MRANDPLLKAYKGEPGFSLRETCLRSDKRNHSGPNRGMAHSGKKRNSLAFSATPPTGGQIEKWPPVVHSREKVQILEFGPSYGPVWSPAGPDAARLSFPDLVSPRVRNTPSLPLGLRAFSFLMPN
jgi:hypothetical protein